MIVQFCLSNKELSMNWIVNLLVIYIIILLTLNLCLRLRILEKMKDKRIKSYQKQWSQIEMNEYNLTRRL